ncbi:hypothetical protein Tco_0323334 [Tanacetum coccineum]
MKMEGRMSPLTKEDKEPNLQTLTASADVPLGLGWLGMIKRSKCENKGIVPTEMELVLEYTQQGASHEVSKPGQYICCQNHKLIADIEDDIMDPVMQCTTPSIFEFLLEEIVSIGPRRLNMQSTVSLTPKHPSDTKVSSYEDGIPARAHIKQA